MYDTLWAGALVPGLGWLSLISLLAGIVYGFAGFGAALVFMPLATLFVAPAYAVAALAVTALSSAVTVLPEAWRLADRRATLTMLGASILTAPLGVYVLRIVAPETLRWAVTAVVAATLIALISGWRYRNTPGPRAWLGVGGLVGFLGTATGINGPALVLFQLGGRENVVRMRANTMVVLTVSGFLVLPQMAVQGALPAAAVGLGIALLLPYVSGILLGRALFRPEREHLYRKVAYGIIASAVVLGLPVFG